jgi:hypothetical protein
MKFEAGQIIVFFLTIYLLLGLTNSVLFHTPNNTNDFVAHYYKTIGDYENQVVSEYYSIEFLENYPQVFHILAKPFATNQFGFYAVAVILICLIAPALLFKLSGNFAVITYFALSLPHLVLYNATFPSFLIMVYFLIYLLNRKKVSIYLILFLLSLITHKHGAIVFFLIGLAELTQLYFTKYDLKEKLQGVKYNLGAGFLVGTKFNTPTQLFNMFSNHLNIYFVWLARKKFDVFYLIILFASIYGAIFYDFRTIMLAQIIICVLVGKVFQETKPSKFFWFNVVFFMFFNFFSLLIETQRFILL